MVAEGTVGGSGIDPKTGRWDWSFGRLAWIDVETTNVWDAESPPFILEVACIVTDADLSELGRYSRVVDYQDLSYLRKAAPYAVDMHLKSGLWERVLHRQGTVPLQEIEHQLVKLVTDSSDPRPVVWAGASPSALDRPVIRHHMPTFHSLLHYRTLDVSSLLLAAKNCGHSLPREIPSTEHRAESDAEEAIEAYRRFCSLISRKTAQAERPEPFSVSAK